MLPYFKLRLCDDILLFYNGSGDQMKERGVSKSLVCCEVRVRFLILRFLINVEGLMGAASYTTTVTTGAFCPCRTT